MTSNDTLAGRYVIEGELGRGSMGRVLIVRDRFGVEASGVPMAAKVLEDPALRNDLLREFRISRRLAHAAFVTPRRLLQLPPTSGRAGLVALSDRVEGRPLLPAPASEAALPLAHQLTAAIDHLHRLGVIHGDLAPPNLLWRETPAGPMLTILDLGLSGAPGDKAGTTSGVLAYAAPERLAGAPLSPASDLWSIGALIYGLAHGRHPFPAYPARLTPLAPAAPAHRLDPWLFRLLSPDPADRHPSAAAALAELEALAAFRPSPRTSLPSIAPPAVALPAPHQTPSADTLWDEVVALVTTKSRDKRPLIIDLRGAEGSGKSRLLLDVAERLAAEGLVTLDLPARDDQPEVWLTDVLDALSWPDRSGGEAQLVTALGRAVRAAGRPVCLTVDDLAERPGLAAALMRLAHAMAAAPERFGPLVILAVGLGATLPADRAPDLGDTLVPLPVPAFGPTEIAQLLSAAFPGRTVLDSDIAALSDLSRGQVGLLVATLQSALEAGAVRVDSAQVRVDRERLASLAPPSLEALARARLARLSDPLRQRIATLAWARFPVPSASEDPAARVDAELVLRGLAVLVSEPVSGLRLASESLARRARELVAPGAGHLALADLYHRAGEPALALAHRLLAAAVSGAAPSAGAPTDEPHLALLASAEAALGPSLAPHLAGFLLDALVATPGWPFSAASALVAARAHERLGRLGPALELYRRAAGPLSPEGSASPPSPRGLALEAASGEGRLASRLGRVSDALAAWERAQTFVPKAAPVDAAELVQRLEIDAGLARAAVLTGALDRAIAVADDALALAGSWTSDPSRAATLDPRAHAAVRARLLYARALADWYRGSLDLAEPRLDEALSAARAADDLVEMAAIVTALGLVAHRRGDLPRAAALYSDALSLGQRAHDDSRILTALQNLGVVRHELGQWTEALDTYQHALSLAEALGATVKVAQIAGNLGNLWRYLGESERAEGVLARGHALALADDNRHLVALIANLRGDVASDRGDLDQAERFYRDAIASAEANGHDPERIEASLNLARLLGERLDLAGAEAVLAPAKALADKANNAAMALQLTSAEAGLLRRRGRDGEALVQRAIAQIEVIKNPDLRWPIYLEAALVARDRGDLTGAETWSHEVRKVLQAQLDQVPGRHREAFSQRRDRRIALRETAAFVERSERGVREGREGQRSPRALGWSRLLEVHKRLASEHNVQRLLEYIMDSAILLTGAERGFLLLDDESHKEGLEVKVARNLDQENIRNRHLKISRGIARRVIASGEPIVTVDAMEDERYKEQLSVVDLKLRSILCLPMSLRGRVLGAIYLDNRFRSSAFTDEDIRFMEAFADMAAIALDNARLLESLENQTKQMAAARKEIEVLNERLAAELTRRTQELEDTKVAMLEERRHQSREYGFENIIGAAPSMRRVFQTIERLRNTDIAVLIEGESGTGKELVARAIHFSGARKDKPFVAVNCGAIPATLLESELFGHVRGAFTNATADKKGLFEVAHTGTLFLDEIGEMPLEMQVKLLRVLQSGEIQKVGATRQVMVDVRIVAATNRRLETEVREGRFREDLFYRLSVVPIVVPPLRERREDIPLLVQHFLAANEKAGLGSVKGITKEALALLQRYGWPGNVRQLETVLKNASVFAESEVLGPRDFDSFPDIVGALGGGHGAQAGSAHGAGDKGLELGGKTLAELERLAIVQALREHKGNKKRTAELLGIDRRTLYNKLAAYGIAIDRELRVK